MTTKIEPSPERVTLVVRPAASHPAILSVQDAMQQVLDFFDLLLPDEQGSGLVWNLSLATTNSPLTVVGVATSFDPAVDISMIARTQRQAVAEQLHAFISGARQTRKLSVKRRNAYRRLFKRNTNGIGRTEATLDVFESPIFITPTIAEAGIAAISADEREFDALLMDNRGREEFGSIEGCLLDVGTEYNQPAILIRERRTNDEIWCRVDPELKHNISNKTTFEDVWDRKRVIVRGRIRYNESGCITRVWAVSVTPVAHRNMTLHDIKDTNFTGSLSITEYLDKLREGNLGK